MIWKCFLDRRARQAAEDFVCELPEPSGVDCEISRNMYQCPDNVGELP